MKFVLLLIGLWVLFRFITDFLLPLNNSAKNTRQKFSDIKNNKEDHGQQSKQAPASEKDYLDFEEIRS